MINKIIIEYTNIYYAKCDLHTFSLLLDIPGIEKINDKELNLLGTHVILENLDKENIMYFVSKNNIICEINIINNPYISFRLCDNKKLLDIALIIQKLNNINTEKLLEFIKTI